MTPTAALRLLGLKAGADKAAIRRAYAERLKAIDLDADPSGYADLRRARDIALAQAARREAAATDASEAGEDAPLPLLPEQAWAYAAPTLDLSGEASVGGRAEPVPQGPLLTVGKDAAPAGPGAEAPRVGPAFATPVLDAPSAEGAVTPQRHPGELLEGLLRATADDVPLDAAEDEQGQHWLEGVLADAESATIDRHEAIENWLASLLAETWPRSAWLAVTAADRFGWERERGQIAERPALTYLNARLGGLRFQQRVADPAHRLHKAWMELSRPGEATFVDRFRAKREDIRFLLDGVRKHYPELEHHFDPARVASWEGSGERVGGPPVGLWIVGILVLIRVLIAIGDANPTPPPVDPSVEREIHVQQEQTVRYIFGPYATFRDIRATQPQIAEMIAANVGKGISERTPGRGMPEVLDEVRRRMLFAAMNGSAADRLALQRVRLGLLRAAQRNGPDVCMNYLRTGTLSPTIEMSQGVRLDEQLLAHDMLADHKLVPLTQHDPAKASVPGALIDQVIGDTKLPERTVRDALSYKGSDAAVCPVLVSLLDRTLRWKGPERDAILRIL